MHVLDLLYTAMLPPPPIYVLKRRLELFGVADMHIYALIDIAQTEADHDPIATRRTLWRMAREIEAERMTAREIIERRGGWVDG